MFNFFVRKLLLRLFLRNVRRGLGLPASDVSCVMLRY